MTGVTVDIDARAVLETLNELQLRMSDLTPVMQQIGNDIKTEVELTFTDQKDPYGRPWAPLSEVTLNRRRQGTGSGVDSILRNTGILANSFQVLADADSVLVGTGIPYASTHQFGARQGQFGFGNYQTRAGQFPIPWGDIPARPMLPLDGLSEDLEAEILDTLTFYLERSL